MRKTVPLLACFIVLASLNALGQSISTPVLDSITPDRAPAGSSTPVTITLTGSRFFSGSAVSIGSQFLETTFINPATLTAVFVATRFTGSGILQVQVINQSNNNSTHSETRPFYLFPASPPKITSVVASIRELTLTDPTQLPATVAATGGPKQACEAVIFLEARSVSAEPELRFCMDLCRLEASNLRRDLMSIHLMVC